MRNEPAARAWSSTYECRAGESAGAIVDWSQPIPATRPARGVAAGEVDDRPRGVEIADALLIVERLGDGELAGGVGPLVGRPGVGRARGAGIANRAGARLQSR